MQLAGVSMKPQTGKSAQSTESSQVSVKENLLVPNSSMLTRTTVRPATKRCAQTQLTELSNITKCKLNADSVVAILDYTGSCTTRRTGELSAF